MRSMWSGTLSFGLINIPVRLYSATEDHAVSFDLLHKTDLSPIRYAKICKETGDEVDYKDIVKGYEYQKGEYVILTEADFKQAQAEHTNTIEILNFSKEVDIDTIYFEKPYFLEPGKGANKSYALLREALYQSKKVGIVRYVFRNREHIGVIKPHLNGIVLDQLRFANEIRQISELKLPDEDMVTKKEVEMALKLIDQLTDDFVPESYHDHYTEELQEIIEQKTHDIEPKKVKGKAKPKGSSKVHDIMALLKASLDEEKASKPPKAAKKTSSVKKRTRS